MSAYQNLITNDMKVATSGIATALLNVTVDAATTSVDQANDDVAAAKAARADSVVKLKAVADFFSSVLKADPKELVKMGSIVGEQIINGAYDDQIKTNVRKVRDAKLDLQHLKDQRFAIAFDTAQAAFDSVQSKTEQMTQGVRDAILARNRAYETAANAAGDKAGGGAEGEKIAGAIKAIPKVKTVLAALDQVTSSAAPPTYSDLSGVAFNAVRKQSPSSLNLQAFVQALADLKGIKAIYGGLKNDWQARLSALENLVAKFNVPSS